jgi:endo-1,4-beta-D-glucanase Y
MIPCWGWLRTLTNGDFCNSVCQGDLRDGHAGWKCDKRNKKGHKEQETEIARANDHGMAWCFRRLLFRARKGKKDYYWQSTTS